MSLRKQKGIKRDQNKTPGRKISRVGRHSTAGTKTKKTINSSQWQQERGRIMQQQFSKIPAQEAFELAEALMRTKYRMRDVGKKGHR